MYCYFFILFYIVLLLYCTVLQCTVTYLHKFYVVLYWYTLHCVVLYAALQITVLYCILVFVSSKLENPSRPELWPRATTARPLVKPDPRSSTPTLLLSVEQMRLVALFRGLIRIQWVVHCKFKIPSSYGRCEAPLSLTDNRRLLQDVNTGRNIKREKTMLAFLDRRLDRQRRFEQTKEHTDTNMNHDTIVDEVGELEEGK